MRSSITAVATSLREMFSSPLYVGMGIAVSFLAFAASLWLHNFNLLLVILPSPTVTVADKALLLWRLLGGISTNVQPWAATLIVIMSLLFGINLMLLLYSLRTREHGIAAGTRGMTVGALVSALFGAGCASCGTYLLGATLASVGASGVLSLLPLGGQELLLVSIALLIVSIIWTAKSTQVAALCAVKPSKSESY